jgi:hypothetical protein
MTVSSKSHQGKKQEEGRSGGVGGKLSEGNTRAMSGRKRRSKLWPWVHNKNIPSINEPRVNFRNF